jgi:hypothetical protein
MQRAAVYDLMVAAPHVPADAHLTHVEFEQYRAGYDWALVTALRALDHAARRQELIVQTKRLDAKRRRAAKS